MTGVWAITRLLAPSTPVPQLTTSKVMVSTSKGTLTVLKLTALVQISIVTTAPYPRGPSNRSRTPSRLAATTFLPEVY